MLIKQFIKNLKTNNYFYIVRPKLRICIELTDYDKAQSYSKAFGGILFTAYPYADYGYQDPYTFAQEWTVLTNYGDKVNYAIDNKGMVKEELTYGSF